MVITDVTDEGHVCCGVPLSVSRSQIPPVSHLGNYCLSVLARGERLMLEAATKKSSSFNSISTGTYG
jgi:hypothetical protein